MVSAARDRSQGSPGDRCIAVSAAFGGTAEIAEARGLVRDFLALVGAVHGLMVTTGTAGMVELVVSELVTNARKYAPGPCLLDLELSEEAVLVSVWDSSTVLPADANRVGQHGLELVMAVCESFCVRREPVGKRVTASVPCSGDPGGDANGGAR
ncbi:ATP-binding protein [Streptomyces rochei]|uniref:ATP-binding protein n=1 Tax=Streptomyces rochei TaxID=1928 RepID=A0ABW7EFQ9_STRRO